MIVILSTKIHGYLLPTLPGTDKEFEVKHFSALNAGQSAAVCRKPSALFGDRGARSVTSRVGDLQLPLPNARRQRHSLI